MKVRKHKLKRDQGCNDRTPPNMKVRKRKLKRGQEPQGCNDRIGEAVRDINALASSWKQRLPKWPRPKQGYIRCGSDCSGYGSDLIALSMLGLQGRVKSVMTCEISETKKTLHAAVAKACCVDMTQNIHYDDMTARSHSDAPTCDLYVAGYPCPSYSNLGKKKGVKDLRGFVTLEGLRYIATKRPRVVVLEQVASILQKKHKKIWNFLEKILTQLDYQIKFKVMNCKDYGVPQSRPRVYVLAVASESLVQEFFLPDGRKDHTDLHWFLDKNDIGSEVLSLPYYEAQLGQKYMTKGYVLDIGASKTFQSVSKNVCPCLTKSRLKSMGYYIPKLKRRLKVLEAARFQSVPPQVLKSMVQSAEEEKLPKNSVPEAIGDAMSLNVLSLVLRTGLDASGLTRLGNRHDFWLNVPVGESSAQLSERLFHKYIVAIARS